MVSPTKIVASLMLVLGVGAFGVVAYEIRDTDALKGATATVMEAKEKVLPSRTAATLPGDLDPADVVEVIEFDELMNEVEAEETVIAQAEATNDDGFIHKILRLFKGGSDTDVATAETGEPVYSSACEMRGGKKICSVTVEYQAAEE